MRTIFVVVALFCAYIAGNHLAHPYVGDLYWQAQLGERVMSEHAIPRALGQDTFTAAGAPWVPHEWLFGVAAALAFRANAVWPLVALVGLAVFVALMLMAVRSKRAGASVMSTLAALLFAGICMEEAFGVRAQVLAWPLLAALMLVLDLDGPVLLLALPIVAAWANVHASVMLAVPLVWADALAYAVQRVRDGTVRTDTGLRWRALLCVGVPLATLCTPFGIALPLYAYDLLHNPIRQYIQEWQPISGFSTQIVAGFIPLVGLCLYAAPRLLRTRPRDVIVTLVMAVWAIVSARNIALFAVVGATTAALAIDEGKGWVDPLAGKRFALVPLLAALVAVPLVAFAAYHLKPMYVPWSPPVRSVAALSTLPGEHDLFCAEYSRCAYALATPNVRVFIDGRADPFPPDVWNAFIAIDEMLPGWQETVDHYKVDAMLVERGSDMETALRGWPAWREVKTDDDCCTLFVRTGKKLLQT